MNMALMYSETERRCVSTQHEHAIGQQGYDDYYILLVPQRFILFSAVTMAPSSFCFAVHVQSIFVNSLIPIDDLFFSVNGNRAPIDCQLVCPSTVCPSGDWGAPNELFLCILDGTCITYVAKKPKTSKQA